MSPSLQKLPLDIKRRILYYTLEPSDYSTPKEPFSGEMEHWNHLVKELVWKERWINPLHIGELSKCQQNKEFIRRIVLLGSAMSLPKTHTGSNMPDEGIPSELENFLQKKWPSLTKLSVLFQKNLNLEMLFMGLKKNVPKLQALDLRIPESKIALALRMVKNHQPRISRIELHTRNTLSWTDENVGIEASLAFENIPNQFQLLKISDYPMDSRLFQAILTSQQYSLSELDVSLASGATSKLSGQIKSSIKKLTLSCIEVKGNHDRLIIKSINFPKLQELNINFIKSKHTHMVENDYKAMDSIFVSSWVNLKSIRIPYISDSISKLVSTNCPHLEVLEVRSRGFNACRDNDPYSDIESLSEVKKLLLTDLGFQHIVENLHSLKVLTIGSMYDPQYHLISKEPIQRGNIKKWKCKDLGYIEIANWKLVRQDVSIIMEMFPKIQVSPSSLIEEYIEEKQMPIINFGYICKKVKRVFNYRVKYIFCPATQYNIEHLMASLVMCIITTTIAFILIR